MEPFGVGQLVRVLPSASTAIDEVGEGVIEGKDTEYADDTCAWWMVRLKTGKVICVEEPGLQAVESSARVDIDNDDDRVTHDDQPTADDNRSSSNNHDVVDDDDNQSRIAGSESVITVLSDLDDTPAPGRRSPIVVEAGVDDDDITGGFSLGTDSDVEQTLVDHNHVDEEETWHDREMKTNVGRQSRRRPALVEPTDNNISSHGDDDDDDDEEYETWYDREMKTKQSRRHPALVELGDSDVSPAHGVEDELAFIDGGEDPYSDGEPASSAAPVRRSGGALSRENAEYLRGVVEVIDAIDIDIDTEAEVDATPDPTKLGLPRAYVLLPHASRTIDAARAWLAAVAPKQVGVVPRQGGQLPSERKKPPPRKAVDSILRAEFSFSTHEWCYTVRYTDGSTAVLTNDPDNLISAKQKEKAQSAWRLSQKQRKTQSPAQQQRSADTVVRVSPATKRAAASPAASAAAAAAATTTTTVKTTKTPAAKPKVASKPAPAVAASESTAPPTPKPPVVNTVTQLTGLLKPLFDGELAKLKQLTGEQLARLQESAKERPLGFLNGQDIVDSAAYLTFVLEQVVRAYLERYGIVSAKSQLLVLKTELRKNARLVSDILRVNVMPALLVDMEFRPELEFDGDEYIRNIEQVTVTTRDGVQLSATSGAVVSTGGQPLAEPLRADDLLVRTRTEPAPAAAVDEKPLWLFDPCPDEVKDTVGRLRATWPAVSYSVFKIRKHPQWSRIASPRQVLELYAAEATPGLPPRYVSEQIGVDEWRSTVDVMADGVERCWPLSGAGLGKTDDEAQEDAARSALAALCHGAAIDLPMLCHHKFLQCNSFIAGMACQVEINGAWKTAVITRADISGITVRTLDTRSSYHNVDKSQLRCIPEVAPSTWSSFKRLRHGSSSGSSSSSSHRIAVELPRRNLGSWHALQPLEKHRLSRRAAGGVTDPRSGSDEPAQQHIELAVLPPMPPEQQQVPFAQSLDHSHNDNDDDNDRGVVVAAQFSPLAEQYAVFDDDAPSYSLRSSGSSTFKPGDRVSALWKDGRWYPGTVRAVRANNQFLIEFDGYREPELHPGTAMRRLHDDMPPPVRPPVVVAAPVPPVLLPAAPAVVPSFGPPVALGAPSGSAAQRYADKSMAEGLWSNGIWYKIRVISFKPPAKYLVEWLIDSSMQTIDEANMRPLPGVEQLYKAGDSVQAMWRDGKYYSATFERYLPGTTKATIRWTVDKQLEDIELAKIRLAVEPPFPAAQHPPPFLAVQHPPPFPPVQPPPPFPAVQPPPLRPQPSPGVIRPVPTLAPAPAAGAKTPAVDTPASSTTPPKTQGFGFATDPFWDKLDEEPDKPKRPKRDRGPPRDRQAPRHGASPGAPHRR